MSGRTVILAYRNAGRISLRNPAAVVIDVSKQDIWQSGVSWSVASLGQRKVGGRPKIGSIVFRFHVMLICGHGRVISYDDMISEFWGADAEGGPLDPARYFWVLRSRAVPLFDWLGMSLETRFGVGYLASFACNTLAKAA
jgi:hypothetical protein